MAISYSLAPNPKWYISDIVGRPLAGGYIATYSNLDHTQLNPIFQDAAGIFPWPYVTIPNVGSLGVLFDENGSQGPFYFKSDPAIPDALYYLEIYDTDGVLQWTIDDFSPSGGSGGSIVTTALDLENLIVNNVMYRNIVASFNPIPSTLTFLAPGAHSGFALTPSNAGPDICFIKNNISAVDQLVFAPFSVGSTPLTGDITPVEYLNYACTNTPTGEIQKAVQYPITQNVKNLSNEDITLSFWANGISGTLTLTLRIRQFFGDGPSASPDINIPVQVFSLTNSWQKYTVQTTIPDITGKTIGECKNDGLFIQVEYPLDASCNIDFCKPCMYLGNISPSQDYHTNDMIDAIINTPRTGDVEESMNYSGNNYVPGGWILLNEGTIGLPASIPNTRANADTFPLFNLLWNGTSNAFCPLLNSAGDFIARGASAVADFVANNKITLPKSMSRVLAGADPIGQINTKTFTASGSILTVDDTSAFYTGSLCNVSTLTGTLPAPLIHTNYWILVVSPTQLCLCSSLPNAEQGSFIVLTTTGSGILFLNFTTAGAHALAQYTGEDSHAPRVAEMASHTHTINGAQDTFRAPFYPSVMGSNLNTQSPGEPIGHTGGGSPFNVLQPTLYVNRIIKL